MGISVPTAELGGTLWEAVAYGVYVALLPQGLRVVRGHGYKSATLRYFMATLAISFLSITMHLAADLARVIVAFTSHPDDARFATHFYSVVNNRLNVLKTAGYIITTIVMDLLIVFRTFIIWNKDWRIILFPAVLCCADIAKSIWIVWSTSLFALPPSTGFFSPALQLLAFFALTLGLNLICTSLIAFKITTAHRLLNRFVTTRSPRLVNALALILESALLYSLLLFVALILAITRSNALYMIFNMLPPMIGIIFLYIILRSAANNSDTSTMQSTIIRSSRATNSYLSQGPIQLNTSHSEFPMSSYTKSEISPARSYTMNRGSSYDSSSNHFDTAGNRDCGAV